MNFAAWFSALTDEQVIWLKKNILGWKGDKATKGDLFRDALLAKVPTNFGVVNHAWLEAKGFISGTPDTPDDTPDEPGEGEEEGEEDEFAPGESPSEMSAIAAMQGWLTDNDLPLSLLGFIRDAIIEGKSMEQISLEIMETPEFKAAYPENDLRKANGFARISLAEIRQYRDQAKQLAQQFGFSADNAQIAKLISKNVSLQEWERRIVATEQLLKYGPGAKQVFEAEMGRPVSDKELLYFFMAGVESPEFDRAWENAAYRGRPLALGLGIRPEEEANLLRQYGVNPDQAFQGYQQVAQNLDRTTYMAAVDKAINAQGFNGAAALQEASMGQLFRAIQLGDPTALRELQDMMSRTVARERQRSGVAFSGRVATGLLTQDEIQNF